MAFFARPRSSDIAGAAGAGLVGTGAGVVVKEGAGADGVGGGAGVEEGAGAA